MDLVIAISPTAACFAVLLFTGIAAPIAGLIFRSTAGGWETIGKGQFAIEQEMAAGGGLSGPGQTVDPEIQAAEVRQMLEAKASRLRRRGEAPMDVEAEAARLLAEGPAALDVEAETRRQPDQIA